jgi:hypothetical protein
VAEASPTGSPEGQQTAFEAFGVRIGVSTTDARVWSRLPELTPPYSQPCDPDDVQEHFSVATGDGSTFTVRYDLRNGVVSPWYDAASYVCSNTDLELALGLLDTHVHGTLALNAPGNIFIEAGVVARSGRAILFPGPALCGKTTLVAALVNAGCLYYSDQYAVLDDQGRVHPYARPLAPLSGGASMGEDPLPVGAVVTTSYRPGAEWRPRALSRGEGVLALLSNTVPAQHRTEEAMHAINRALEQGPVMMASERGEAVAVAAPLLATLERETAAAP